MNMSDNPTKDLALAIDNNFREWRRASADMARTLQRMLGPFATTATPRQTPQPPVKKPESLPPDAELMGKISKLMEVGDENQRLLLQKIETEHAATRREMPKAAKYGYNLAMNDRDKGSKKIGGQRKVLPQRMRTALRKVDALLDSGEAASAAEACRAVHKKMALPIAFERFQNIYSNPKEKAAVGYKKTPKNPKASRK